MPLLKRRAETFTVQVQDMLLRVTAPEEYYEECRAAALSAWEQIQAAGIRNSEFRASRLPVAVAETAPPVIREMADAARAAGVGPMFTVNGAVIDHVGRYLARSVSEITVASGGDYFLRTRKRVRLPVHQPSTGETLSIIVDSRRQPVGVATTLGRGQIAYDTLDGLAVLAASCTLADAAAAAVMAILTKPRTFRMALAHLKRMRGVQGALLIQGERIGVAGSVEVVH